VLEAPPPVEVEALEDEINRLTPFQRHMFASRLRALANWCDR
jgi:hypothetical protein